MHNQIIKVWVERAKNAHCLNSWVLTWCTLVDTRSKGGSTFMCTVMHYKQQPNPVAHCSPALCIRTAAVQFQLDLTSLSDGYSNCWTDKLLFSTFICGWRLTLWLLKFIVKVWHVPCWLSCLSGRTSSRKPGRLGLHTVCNLDSVHLY